MVGPIATPPPESPPPPIVRVIQTGDPGYLVAGAQVPAEPSLEYGLVVPKMGPLGGSPPWDSRSSSPKTVAEFLIDTRVVFDTGLLLDKDPAPGDQYADEVAEEIGARGYVIYQIEVRGHERMRTVDLSNIPGNMVAAETDDLNYEQIIVTAVLAGLIEPSIGRLMLQLRVAPRRKGRHSKT